jgi:hypothetical protein
LLFFITAGPLSGSTGSPHPGESQAQCNRIRNQLRIQNTAAAICTRSEHGWDYKANHRCDYNILTSPIYSAIVMSTIRRGASGLVVDKLDVKEEL